MIWRAGKRKISCGERTLIMGIVNVTPDSFSDGAEHMQAQEAVQHALTLIEEGADIIDIGAQSTRPGSTTITAGEELSRLEGVLEELRKKTKAPISVDTFYPEVAERALSLGADIINDVSGTVDEKMAELIRSHGAGWVITHNGSGGVNEVRAFFENALSRCESLGIDCAQICLDMGIGFGKTRQQDRELIANLPLYRIEGVPILLGASRKRVIGEASRQEIPCERVYGNISADTAAILGGVDIIRLHDVKNEIQGILMAQALKGAIIDG